MAKKTESAAVPMVALLRGINVGGKNVVPMPELKKVFEGLGHGDVSTYIASGNVLFTSGLKAVEVAAAAEAAIAKRFKVSLPRVVVRTREELAAAIAAAPFKGDPARVLIGFCAEKPAANGARLRRTPPMARTCGPPACKAQALASPANRPSSRSSLAQHRASMHASPTRTMASLSRTRASMAPNSAPGSLVASCAAKQISRSKPPRCRRS